MPHAASSMHGYFPGDWHERGDRGSLRAPGVGVSPLGMEAGAPTWGLPAEAAAPPASLRKSHREYRRQTGDGHACTDPLDVTPEAVDATLRLPPSGLGRQAQRRRRPSPG